MVELIGGALKKEPEETVVEIHSEGEEAEKVVKIRRRRRKKACDPHQNRACVDCKKRCARIHGRAASSSQSPSSSKTRPVPAVPSFFKVMMGYFSEHMDIPPPFARTILDLAGSNIYLEDAFGLRWRVRLCLRDGVLSLGHGWKNFVLDHAVSCGEFLVFRQIARSVFTVQMFAPSAVERLFLCEANRRQSRKRKPRQKTSCPSSQTVKISKNCNKKQRTDHHNDLGPKDCHMPDHVFIDDSDFPQSASEPKCSETSGGVPEVGVAEPQEDSEAPTGHDCKAQEVLDGEAEIADDCTVFEVKESECNARVIQHLVSDATEIEHGDGLNLPTNTDAIGPLAMIDLNEVNIDDIFLSADIYEFETDTCNPEAFSVDLNMRGPSTTAQNSGLSCLEDTQQNHFSSMGDDQRLVMPETLSCTENKQMTDALVTGTGYACVAVHDIDINALPANEPASFAKENSPTPADPEVHSSECVLNGCNKDNDLLSCKDSQAEHKVENNSEGIRSGTSESGGVLALAASSSKFCIAAPAPDQSWLELPIRLPVIPRTKKQGRKVVILRDPCMRLWPVLYQCKPRFSGFITGWVDVCRENSLQEGDTCEFELSGNSELSFQVLVPNLQ
ncbi:hypothetical protein C2845_PM07G32010 [Panicum miliaceum]|uniref:TF-B3 domain-containing protein n=1 Tax=Panicum miliaceum TaxID=4540 RepID=A0A3L6SJD3_PANMI|nr:hypothetical protein C2845_PM07G32010 [Panicum miliaceum]